MEKSYVCGPSDRPLLYRSMSEVLDSAVARWGERPCLVVRHQGVRMTYREFAAAVEACAAGLLALGLQPGERVGIWSPNNAEWVIMQFATGIAGLILVNINPAYRKSELEYALKKTGCRALVLAQQFKSSDYLSMLRELAPELFTADSGPRRAPRFPALEFVIHIGDGDVPGCQSFAAVAAQASARSRADLKQIAQRLQPDDPVNIQFTSGTTGFPKGATLSHCNIVNNAFFVAERMGLTEQDRLCIPVPLYHCFGMVLGVLACVTHGAAMVFPGEAFEPGSVLEAVAAERCTALHGVPTMFIAELEHPDFQSFDLSTLRTGIMAGSPCPIEVMKRVVERMHMREVTICYGMTETSPVSFQSEAEDPLQKRVSTVGRIHPFVEARVVDENGQVAARGTQGELHTRGYNVMRGYWGDPERSREAIDEAGWMHTGDLACIDGEGYCSIVGRVKDMIIRGGENIYPREIEEFLFRHPAIRDVQVFGVPDRKYGEAVCAWICLQDGTNVTEDDIREFCSGEIAHFKVPKFVRFVESFPMTVTGKAQKFVMRDRMKAELGLGDEPTA